MHSIFLSLHHCLTSFCSLLFLVLILVILSFIPSPPFRLYNPDPTRSKVPFDVFCTSDAVFNPIQRTYVPPAKGFAFQAPSNIYSFYSLSYFPFAFLLLYFFNFSVSFLCFYRLPSTPQPFISRRTSTVRPPASLPHSSPPPPPSPRYPRHERLTHSKPLPSRLHTLCHPMPPYALRSSFVVSMPFPFCSFSLSLPATPRSCLLTYCSPVQRPRFQRCSHSPTP